MEYPKISVIVHCFNRENFIAETLDSILNQKYPNLELVVIDDGSTDKSWEIIETYKDSITYREQLTGKRDSPIIALNRGFEKSTGDIMCWLNTKNILLGKSLFVVADVFQKQPTLRWLTGLGSMIEDNGRVIRVRSFRKNIYDYLLGNWETIQQESTFWRRSLWEETGSQLDPTFPWSFDAALWAKFFLVERLYHINTILGAYRQIAQSMSIARKGEFLQNTRNVLADFKRRTPRSLVAYAYFYAFLRVFKPILAFIPDTVYARIPLLSRFSYACISYHSKSGTWEPARYEKNPFNDRIQ